MVNDQDVQVETETVRYAVFTVRLPYEDHQALRRIAFEHETSINSEIRSLVADFLTEHAGCGICD
jgi:hypothetical protein